MLFGTALVLSMTMGVNAVASNFQVPRPVDPNISQGPGNPPTLQLDYCRATYISSVPWENVVAVELDKDGNVLVVGRGGNLGTSGTYMPEPVDIGSYFVMKLSPDLKRRLWTTYFATSSGKTFIRAIATDSSSDVYIGGVTLLNGKDYTGGFVAKLSGQTGNLLWGSPNPTYGSDYLGSSVNDIAVDKNNRIYVTGRKPGNIPAFTSADPQKPVYPNSVAYVDIYNSDGSKIVDSSAQGGIVIGNVNASPCTNCSSGTTETHTEGYRLEVGDDGAVHLLG
ncbi:MAG: SBBP repeat-containing protein, partial [Methylacidiphilales bacterium]|nr:SBBP repeat-containing protein [Candidatus Methylacidiphilales bacterium]